jgi:hypothetical protein
MKKKLNQDQTSGKRRPQHLKKKKYRHKKIISDQTIHQFSHSAEMIQLVEDEKTLSMVSSSSLFIKKECFPLLINSNTDPTLFLTDFSMISYLDLKEMFLTIIIDDNDQKLLNKVFNHEEIMFFIRQLTQLINKLHYTKLQNEQWTYYYNLGIQEGIWTGRVSKNMALNNSMCYTYGRSKILIEQRGKKYQQNMVRIQDEVKNYMEQVPTVLKNVHRIMDIINDLVNKDQYQLRIELERRRHMLQFDAKDHQFVQHFYQLKPRKTEV